MKSPIGVGALKHGTSCTYKSIEFILIRAISCQVLPGEYHEVMEPLPTPSSNGAPPAEYRFASLGRTAPCTLSFNMTQALG